jgi:hypothetical protein
MATYDFKGAGHALPYDASGFTALRVKVNLPALIAAPQNLALAATPNTPLTSFSGMVQNDILNVFSLPRGFSILQAGVRVTTAEGATAAATMGYDATTHLGVADPNGLIATIDLNTAAATNGTYTLGEVSAAGGPDNVTGVVFDEAGNVTMTFTTDDTYAVAIFDVFVCGFMTLA